MWNLRQLKATIPEASTPLCVSMTTSLLCILDLFGCRWSFLVAVISGGLLLLDVGGFSFLAQAGGGPPVVVAVCGPTKKFGIWNWGGPQFLGPTQFWGPRFIFGNCAPQLVVCIVWAPSKTGGAGILGDCWYGEFNVPNGEYGPNAPGNGNPPKLFTLLGAGVGSPASLTGPHSMAISTCTPRPPIGTV